MIAPRRNQARIMIIHFRAFSFHHIIFKINTCVTKGLSFDASKSSKRRLDTIISQRSFSSISSNNVFVIFTSDDDDV
jgi:hypothetical protein